ALALLSCLNVGESKVYAFKNTRDDHFIGGIREALIHAGLLNGLGDRGCHREATPIRKPKAPPRRRASPRSGSIGSPNWTALARARRKEPPPEGGSLEGGTGGVIMTTEQAESL